MIYANCLLSLKGASTTYLKMCTKQQADSHQPGLGHIVVAGVQNICRPVSILAHGIQHTQDVLSLPGSHMRVRQALRHAIKI